MPNKFNLYYVEIESSIITDAVSRYLYDEKNSTSAMHNAHGSHHVDSTEAAAAE